MSYSINSKEYWEHRFASGDWEKCRGRRQTTSFAERQAQLLRLPGTFNGILLDFGCGLGDALPIYKKRLPLATLIGIDHSESAIVQCKKKYGHIATFTHGGCDSVPQVDVIIASNVIEHITDQKLTLETLRLKCSELYIIVPYMENPICSEHTNYYDMNSFPSFEKLETELFYSPGWSQYGHNLWVGIYLKNLLRPFFGKPLVQRRKQIMFRIKGTTYSPK